MIKQKHLGYKNWGQSEAAVKLTNSNQKPWNCYTIDDDEGCDIHWWLTSLQLTHQRPAHKLKYFSDKIMHFSMLRRAINE